MLIDNLDINTATEKVTNKILQSAELSIPHKIIQIRKQDPPWMNSNIRKMSRKRLHRKVKQTNNINDWSKFRKIRNSCINLVRSCKKQFLEKQIQKIESPSEIDMQSWWKILKNMTGLPTKKSVYPTLCINDQYVENDSEKANCFHVYFCEQSSVDDSTQDCLYYK